MKPSRDDIILRLRRAEDWLNRIKRVRRLRELAREEEPKELVERAVKKPNETRHLWKHAVRSSYILRYQIFVGRSDLPASTPAEMVFQYGPPHFRMAVDMYIAQQKLFVFLGRFHSYRDPTPKDLGYPTTLNIEYMKARNGSDYRGIMLILPPRHGKTAMERHWVGLTASLNPRTQGAYVHARDVEANKFLKSVSDLFSRSTTSGRRNLSLFGDLRLAERDNSAGRFRLAVPDPPSNPTLIAAGISASAQGNNLDWIIPDDIVSDRDQDSPTTREATKRKLRGTWMTRVQGKDGGFVIVSGYPWHSDDAIWDMMALAAEAERTDGRKGIRMRVCKMTAGGPSEGFTPVWPGMYDANWLRKKYQELGAATYAAQYQMQPLTDEMKIVKSVRLYDPKPLEDEDQHARFVENCDIHLSIDPAFTNTDTSDYAGVVMLGVGEVEDVRAGDTGVSHVSRRTVVRVLEVVEMKATQSELNDYIIDNAAAMPIHTLHIETAGGGGALVQMLESFDICENVIQHTTGGRNKEVRLRNVAMLMENGSPGLRARVEFLGRRDEDKRGDDGMVRPGELRLDPSMKAIVDYVENFKVSSGYHSLDALTQAVKYIGEHYGFSHQSAEISRQAIAARFAGNASMNRMREHIKRMKAEHTMDEDATVMSRDEFGRYLGGSV